MKKEFLQLAHPLSDDVHIGGWFWSEKLDGHRCFWDGGVTRGLKKSDVPWANIGKDARFVNQQICTGLWSRYGHIIFAPDTLIDRLPSGLMLDGELYDQRNRESLASCVKRQDSSGDWASVEYRCFDAVSATQFGQDRDIEYGHKGYKVRLRGVVDWLINRGIRDGRWAHRTGLILAGQWAWHGGQLPGSHDAAVSDCDIKMSDIIGRGGEGLIVRHPDREWSPWRAKWIRKIKPMDASTGTVIAITEGKGRHLGRIGGLIVEDNGVQFGIGTGLSDILRSRNDLIGKIVRYGHRGYSAAGIPIETRLLGVVE